MKLRFRKFWARVRRNWRTRADWWVVAYRVEDRSARRTPLYSDVFSLHAPSYEEAREIAKDRIMNDAPVNGPVEYWVTRPNLIDILLLHD